MTNAEFATAFPAKLFAEFPKLKLFNPMVRDITLIEIKLAATIDAESPIEQILDNLFSDEGVILIAGGVYACLTRNPNFGVL